MCEAGWRVRSRTRSVCLARALQAGREPLDDHFIPLGEQAKAAAHGLTVSSDASSAWTDRHDPPGPAPRQGQLAPDPRQAD